MPRIRIRDLKSQAKSLMNQAQGSINSADYILSEILDGFSVKIKVNLVEGLLKLFKKYKLPGVKINLFGLINNEDFMEELLELLENPITLDVDFLEDEDKT